MWYFQIVMWLQNWSVTWLFWDPVMQSKHPAKFAVHRSCESGNIPFFYLPCDHLLDVSRDFLDGVPSSKVTTLLSLGFIGLVKGKIQRFLLVTWPRYRSVTWLCGWSPLILSHQTATFGIHRSCQSRKISFLCVTWPQHQNVTWLWGWGSLILNDHLAKFRVHRPYGTENNAVCNFSSNSNSISNSNSNPQVYKWSFAKAILYVYMFLKEHVDIFNDTVIGCSVYFQNVTGWIFSKLVNRNCQRSMKIY